MTEHQQEQLLSFCSQLYADRDAFSKGEIIELIIDAAIEITEQREVDREFKDALDELYRSRLNNKPTKKNRQY